MPRTRKSVTRRSSARQSSAKKTLHRAATTHETVYFDDFTRFAYADYEPMLLQQLCRGHALVTNRVFHAEMGHFLDDEHRREAKAHKDVTDLCFFLNSHHKMKQGVVKRLQGAIAHGTGQTYHWLLQTLFSSNYFARCVNSVRDDNWDPLFHYLYFVKKDTGKRTSRTATATMVREFLHGVHEQLGTEFALVKAVNYLTQKSAKYRDIAAQLQYMVKVKGFEFNDLFSGRNPAYYVASTDADLRRAVQSAKNKIDGIVIRIEALCKALKAKPELAKQTKQLRELRERQRRDAQEQMARVARRAQGNERIAIEREKLLFKRQQAAKA